MDHYRKRRCVMCTSPREDCEICPYRPRLRTKREGGGA